MAKSLDFEETLEEAREAEGSSDARKEARDEAWEVGLKATICATISATTSSANPCMLSTDSVYTATDIYSSLSCTVHRDPTRKPRSP